MRFGGDNLAQWAADGTLSKLSMDARLALFLQIIDAVAAAHSVGVLHKDLKPENILVMPRGDGGWQIRVADFGSGRLLEPGRLEELGITQLGAAATADFAVDSKTGTPLYLAPELLTGANAHGAKRRVCPGHDAVPAARGGLAKAAGTGMGIRRRR